jgi:hypothetical protein
VWQPPLGKRGVKGYICLLGYYCCLGRGREVLLVATIPGTSLAVTVMTAFGMIASDKEDNFDAVAMVPKGGVMLYVEIYHRAQVRSFVSQDLFLPHLSALTWSNFA